MSIVGVTGTCVQCGPDVRKRLREVDTERHDPREVVWVCCDRCKRVLDAKVMLVMMGVNVEVVRVEDSADADNAC